MPFNSEKLITIDVAEIITIQDTTSLRVHLGATDLYLQPLVLKDGSTIFIFDPREIHARQAGADALIINIQRWLTHKEQDAAKPTKVIRLLTPQSSKSEGMVQDVADFLGRERACALDTGMFQKGNSEAELKARLGEDAIIQRYTPITHKSGFIGISQEQAHVLRTERDQGMPMLLVDDVISTGATIEAMQKLLHQVFEVSEAQIQAEIPVFAALREIPQGQTTDADPQNWYYSGTIPVILPTLQAA